MAATAKQSKGRGVSHSRSGIGVVRVCATDGRAAYHSTRFT